MGPWVRERGFGSIARGYLTGPGDVTWSPNNSATVSCCAHKLRILNVYLVDNGTKRQLCVLEGGDQCAVHGFSSCA